MFVGALALFDTASTLEVSNRAEARGRSTANAAPSPSLDLVDTPAARFTLTSPSWQTTLGYSVMALLPDVETGGSPEVLQSADTGVAWKGRRVRLGLAEYGLFGQENTAFVLASPAFAGGAGSAPPVQGVQALSTPVALDFGSSRTVLVGEAEVGRLWRATTSVEYDVQGGLDATSRTILPVVQGPRVDAATSVRASPLDTFETRASALRSETSSGPCSPIVLTLPAGATCAPTAETAQLVESWQRKLSRRSTVSFGAGASLSAVRLQPNGAFDDAAYPVALASWQLATTAAARAKAEGPGGSLPGESPTAGLVRAEFSVQPVLDLRTGVLDERAQGTLTGVVPFGSTAFSALVGGARTIESTFIAPITSVQGVLEVDQRVSRAVGIGGGVRYAWQEEDPIGTFSGGMIFVQVTVRAPVVRF